MSPPIHLPVVVPGLFPVLPRRNHRPGACHWPTDITGLSGIRTITRGPTFRGNGHRKPRIFQFAQRAHPAIDATRPSGRDGGSVGSQGKDRAICALPEQKAVGGSTTYYALSRRPGAFRGQGHDPSESRISGLEDGVGNVATVRAGIPDWRESRWSTATPRTHRRARLSPTLHCQV